MDAKFKAHSFWARYPSWEQAQSAWDEKSRLAALNAPIKGIRTLPKMPAMTDSTRRFFRIKALAYLIYHDRGFKLLKALAKRPFCYFWGYLKSCIRRSSYQRSGDFFLYGLNHEQQLVQKYLQQPCEFILGFSYCHKPFECPDGRFSDLCRADENNTVCMQCFIGKAVHAAPLSAKLLFIPTIHYIAQKVFEAVQTAQGKRVLFLISACEMTLEMFGDWGNAVGLEGIGVRLDGRICNTMEAFVYSERGIKPGLTVVLKPTQERILQVLKSMNKN